MMVTDLKSEALKDRHWKELRKRLRLNVVMAELTLGHIWDADLQRNEAAVKDVILVAQGEMALEEFLKQVKKYAVLTINADGYIISLQNPGIYGIYIPKAMGCGARAKA